MFAEVHRVEQLTPSMVRVRFTGGELEQFNDAAATDAYVNARFLPRDSPVSVPFEKGDLEGVAPHHQPRPRRYTVRAWDSRLRELVIDFVAHGDEGYAGPWAQHAKPGDRLQFVGPRGNYRPSSEVDWHLFVGDESALPAIGASLDVLSSGDVARVFALVDGPGHEYPLPSNGNVEVTWLYRNGAVNPDALLPDAVAEANFPTGGFDVFVHGEAGEVRAVRRHLLVDRGVDVGEESISPYWRRTYSDEAWREVKRDFMAEQSRDR